MARQLKHMEPWRRGQLIMVFLTKAYTRHERELTMPIGPSITQE